MEQSKQIEELSNSRNLSVNEAELVEDCMIDLCTSCDKQKNFFRLNNLFANLSDGVILFDLNNNILDANKKGQTFLAEYQLLNYENKNYTLRELLEDIESTDSSLIKERSIKAVSFNEKNERIVFNINVSGIYSAFSKLTGVCVVVTEVTELEKQTRQLEDMMASFTHDLKTPLIALETNIEHILDNEYGELSDDLRKILGLMLRTSSNALRLVKNLLTVFKYDTKSYKLLPKNIKAREVINNAIQAVDPLLSVRKIRVTTDLKENYSIYCDSFEIERVITNLLSNAIKFSDEGSLIKIFVREEKDFYIFSVEDEGMGIPKEMLSFLFERFWQSKVYSSSTNGTGLGLYLSRQIVEAHRGSIWVESEINKGTKVFFKIPKSNKI